MKIITIKRYEMCCLSRWGWHTFRDGKDYKGKIIGFRFMGIGLCWRKNPVTDLEIESNRIAGEILLKLKTGTKSERDGLLSVIEKFEGLKQREKVEEWLQNEIGG